MRNIDMTLVHVGEPDRDAGRGDPPPAAGARAGADGISGIFFAVNTVAEYLAQMRLFAREVMPALKQG